MVNTALLKDHASKYKITKETAAEYHKQLFKLHPDLAPFYDAEDIDPDAIPKAQKFIMLGQAELQYFLKLPSVFGEERPWRSALANFKEQYGDVGFPMEKFNKTPDAFLAAMEKNAGGVTAEQKKNWEELFNKAYADMKSWGWF